MKILCIDNGEKIQGFGSIYTTKYSVYTHYKNNNKKKTMKNNTPCAIGIIVL